MSWLWRSDSSAASFEKALAKLSGQISSASVSLDKTRSRSRRAKALWTLYTSIAYLISVLILVLVIGPQDWTVPHYGGLVGAPLSIYGVRQAITAISGWSIARQQSHVDRLQKEREEKIAQLKKATKYDSTQELLQKYGGAPPSQPRDEAPEQGTKGKTKDTRPQTPVQRTGLPPPPTANIQRRSPPIQISGRPHTPNDTQSLPTAQGLMQSPVTIEEPGFAPNAFSQAPPSRAAYEHTSHWYDRILDVMLGEDEAQAKNRLALLCQSCRLVNGQAPPGVKTLEELGRWRCQSCGAWNGVQVETTKMVQEMAEKRPTSPAPRHEDDDDQQHEFEESGTLDGSEGSTGHDKGADTSSISKRVTRSAKKPVVEGL
ncbi:hypothetical protein LTR05_007507 [Lithohypha guttulata]|uniref:Endoplasmic reticulum junction formation protein lunapark n=1 Tax=Lithohypha guttulata TaxID=1690604 RepID=A0AAN7YDT8_9EURO|nr:hypothetical protein LTR05_007507 [Lithohypha guttulata]